MVEETLSTAMIQHPAPAFVAQAVFPDKNISNLNLDDYRGAYVVLFFYPADHTFVCPTEIVSFSDRQSEFSAINTQVIAVSCDSTFSHLAWINIPRNQGGLGDMKIPIVSDLDKSISRKYGVLIEDEGVPLRGLFIISPTGILRQATINDLPVGRNVDEIVRLVKAFQFTDEFGEVCPANWTPGAPTMHADPIRSKEYFSSSSSSDGRPQHTATAVGPGEVTRVHFGAVATRPAKGNHRGVLGWCRRTFRTVLSSYCSALKERPLRSRALTAAVLGMLGELLGAFVRHRKLTYGAGKRGSFYRQTFGWDGEEGTSFLSLRRLLSFGLYGLVIGGPAQHYWHQFMNYLLMPAHATHSLTSEMRLVKVALSQAVLTPPLVAAMIASLHSLTTGQSGMKNDPKSGLKSVFSAGSEFRNVYAAALFTNWRWLTVAQAANQTVVSPDHRVLVEHLMVLWWNVYMSVCVVPPGSTAS